MQGFEVITLAAECDCLAKQCLWMILMSRNWNAIGVKIVLASAQAKYSAGNLKTPRWISYFVLRYTSVRRALGA